MGSLGWQEMMVIFLVALLVFGPKKLPELGKTLAKAMGEFRRASNELKGTWQREMDNIERETKPIQEEAQKMIETTSEYTDSHYHDSSYDYGSYDYPDSSANPEADTSSTDTHPVSASAIQGADNAVEEQAAGGIPGSDPDAGAAAAPTVAPEGTVATGPLAAPESVVGPR